MSPVTLQPSVLPALAAYGLRGSLHSLPDDPLDRDSWRALVVKARSQRVAGHLLEAALEAALPTTEEQIEEVADLHTAAMVQSLRLERLLLETLDGLDQAGVGCQVIKGPAIARTAYPDPSLRVFGDIDLLVPAEQFDAAIGALQARGCRRRWPQVRPGFDRRFGKGATLVAPTGQELDVHRTFVLGPFGLTVDLDALFATRSFVEIGGRKVETLEREEQFLLACYHAALGTARPRLVPLRDVAQLLLTTPLDETRVLELARHWKGEPVVAQAIRTVWEVFRLADSVPLSVWATRYTPSPRAERALAIYRRPVNSYTRKALASLRVIPGIADKALFLRALLLPNRATRQSYEGSLAAWWRRGGKALIDRGGD